jgi:hypothetical protein
MGIMPADRELKWQRVFRRFGLPSDRPVNDSAPDGEGDQRKREMPKPSDGQKSPGQNRKP